VAFSVATGQREKEKQLQREATRLVENGIPGVEVLALEVTGKDRFCVYIDHPQGVDHALCERVSTMLRPYHDQYAIEVSSPGPEPPLRTRAHFERVVGRAVRVKTDTGRARGEVLAAGERAFQIRNDSEPTEIPYDAIVRANVIEEGRK
jgi:ribosome maturation factor RimP